MEILFMLLGGLGLFLYGMEGMSRGLQNIAGEKLKSILQTLTSNRFIGVVTGAVGTAIVQSSGVMTVMVVGFVNAGLMTLAQAISVIIGANIGTTITGQIIAFPLEEFSLPIIALGSFLILFSRRERIQTFGRTLFCFGILFYGFFLMSSAFKPLGNDPMFQNFLSLGDQPLFGVILGLLFTIFVQSSSLTIGVTIAIAQNDLITFQQALPLIIGMNIGSTITANIAAIPGSYVAKQAARAHLVINLLTAIVALIFLGPFADLISSWTPQASAARLIANAHTFFNVGLAIITLPLIAYIGKATRFLVSGEKEQEDSLAFLDETSLADPGTALDQVKRALIDMHGQISDLLRKIAEALIDSKKIDSAELLHAGNSVERYERRLTSYLQKIAERKITKKNSHDLSQNIRLLHELTRMYDYAERLKEIIQDKNKEDLHFSTPEKRDLRLVYKAVEDLMKKTLSILNKGDMATAESVITGYENLRNLRDASRTKSNLRFSKHMTTLPTMQHYIDILNAFEEIGKKCSNIAETVRVS